MRSSSGSDPERLGSSSAALNVVDKGSVELKLQATLKEQETSETVDCQRKFYSRKSKLDLLTVCGLSEPHFYK